MAERNSVVGGRQSNAKKQHRTTAMEEQLHRLQLAELSRLRTGEIDPDRLRAAIDSGRTGAAGGKCSFHRRPKHPQGIETRHAE